MKRLFVETHYHGDLTIPKDVMSKLPSKLILTMPVQFLPGLDRIKKQLESAGKEVEIYRGLHDKYAGQILGCDVFTYNTKMPAFLYIGDGMFHPTALLYENEKTVYCYNPFNEKFIILEETYLEKLQKKKKGVYIKFLHSTNVGILVTTKPGQMAFSAFEKLRDSLEAKGKTVFMFMADEINLSMLDNFNFIDVWINTACPRIVEDFTSLNFQDLAKAGYLGKEFLLPSQHERHAPFA